MMKKVIFKLTPENHRKFKIISIQLGIPYQYLLESFVDNLIDYDRGQSSKLMSALIKRAEALAHEKAAP